MNNIFFDSNYFTNYSNVELVKEFNKEVWNKWWTSSRAEYLSLFHNEFNNRWIDYSEIWDSKNLSFKHKIKLNKLKFNIIID